MTAGAQARAVGLIDKLGPILGSVSEQPRPDAWADLARAAEHLQDFYQLSFAGPATHPESGRSQALAAQIGTLLDRAAHEVGIGAQRARPLTLAEKATCAAHAATVAEHLRQCLGTLGQRLRIPRDAGNSEMTEETVDEELGRDLDEARSTYQQLARATRSARS